jgi:D-3-phosphoglycerate dehydrogenase
VTPPRVVVFGPGYDDYRTELDVLAPLGVERIEPVAVDAPDADARLSTAAIVLVREAPLPAERIARLERCRAIVRYGVGVDNIDLAAAAARGIYVANVPDYGSHEVAEHALALILATARRIAQRDRAVRAGAWGVGAREPIARLAGSTLGLIGFGRIAETLWRKTAALGFAATLVHDPVRTTFPDGVRPVDLDTLLAGADVISLHAPLTDATRRLVDADRLAHVRPGAVLVNTARGGLIDEAALLAALDEGRLRGAGLDVFEEEPLPADHPLRDRPQVVLTDHTGWYSDASLDELQRGAATEAARVLRGEEPENWVNRWAS